MPRQHRLKESHWFHAADYISSTFTGNFTAAFREKKLSTDVVSSMAPAEIGCKYKPKINVSIALQNR